MVAVAGDGKSSVVCPQQEPALFLSASSWFRGSSAKVPELLGSLGRLGAHDTRFLAWAQPRPRGCTEVQLRGHECFEGLLVTLY